MRFDTEGTLFGEVDGAAEAAPQAKLYCSVAVNRPLRCEFTYAVPNKLAPGLGRGSRVAVPFGSRREVGVAAKLFMPKLRMSCAAIGRHWVTSTSKILKSRPPSVPLTTPLRIGWLKIRTRSCWMSGKSIISIRLIGRIRVKS